MRAGTRDRIVHSWMLVVAALLLAAPVAAGPYTKLQVLLPGESPAPGTATGRSGAPSPQVAGEPFTITVRACDDTWNTTTGITNLIDIASSDASATLPASARLTAGVADFTVTLNAAGTFTVSAHDATDNTIPNATSSPVPVQVLHGFEFSRITQKNQYAGQPMSISLTARDPNGNLVLGYSGPVRLQEITSYGDGRVTPDMVTLDQGSWSGDVTMYRADETSINRGNVNLYASLPGNPSKNGTSDPFTVHPGPFTRLQIVVPGQSPLPGSQTGLVGTPASQAAGVQFTVTVYSTDLYWNPLPSADVVRITSNDAQANTPLTGALQNGSQQFNVALGTVGTQMLTVSDQTNTSIQSMTSAGISVLPSAAQQFIIETIPTPLTAGVPIGVTIHAADGSGNTIPDFAGDAVLSANTGAGSITPELVSFTNGTWAGNVVFRGAGGAVTLSCADFSSPPHLGTSNSFEVMPGPFASLQVLVPGESPRGGTADGREGQPSDQNAGTSFPLTVRAVDAYWNLVGGVNHRIALGSTDAFATMPPETTLVGGQLVFPVTLFRTGPQHIWASDVDSAAVRADTSSAVPVNGGPFSRLLVLAPGESPAPGTTTGRTGTATDQSINYAFTITVLATDSWWNPVGGVSDVARLSCSDPLAVLPPDTPLVDGRADMTMRLSTGGYQQITVTDWTDPGKTGSTTQVRAISSGFHLEAVATPDTVQADESFTLTVRVTNDAGSVIQEINSFVTVEVLNASTREPGRGTLQTTRFQLLQGQRSISETYRFAEPIVIVARDDAGNDPGITDAIVVVPGAPTYVRQTSPEWIGGNKHAALEARLVDAYENGIGDQPMTFELLSGAGTLSPIDSVTSNDGTARADYLSPREPEKATIRASYSSSVYVEFEIETAFVNPNAGGGTIASYPNPFHPREAPATIAYKLDDNAAVTLQIYTLTGDLVRRVDFPRGQTGGVAGLNTWIWDGRNGDGKFVSSGGYVVRVEAQGEGQTLHVMHRKIAVVH